ncbi:MAG: hypothetical protein V4549_19245 [Bacteroidota bacterium]
MAMIRFVHVAFISAFGFTVIQKDGVQTSEKDLDAATTPVKLSVTLCK